MADYSHRWADLPDDWREQLGDERLREDAGDTVFERGQAYFLEGKAKLVRDGGGSASFRVKGSGSQTYDTELYFEDVGMHVDCSCPHAQQGDFCKHMVAAALVWRAQLSGEDLEPNQPVAGKESAQNATNLVAKNVPSPAQKRAATVADKRTALAQFLAAQPASVLAERLMEAGEEDRSLLTQLNSWHAQHLAEQAPTGIEKAKAWKEVLNELLKKRSDFYHWKNLGGYIRNADEAVKLLREIAHQDPLQGREACFFAMRKLYAVGMHTDDSSGSLGDVMRDVADLINQTLIKLPPQGKDASAFGEAWHKLMAEDPWGIWDEEATLAVAGEDVQAWANKKAEKDWQDWLVQVAAFDLAQASSQAAVDALKSKPKKTPEDRKSLTKAEREHAERFGSYAKEATSVRHGRWLLHKRYVKALERQQDFPGLYAIHQVCTTPQAHAEAFDWITLIEWCNAHGREREMLQWVKAGLKAFPDDWRLKDLLLQCYERDGYDQEAFDIRMARVKKSPSVENYDLALKSAKATGKDVAQCRAELFAWAEAREEQLMKKPVPQYGWSQPGRVVYPLRDVSVRVAWLLYDKLIDDALNLAQTASVVVDLGLLDVLAKNIQATKPLVAGKLLLRIFDTKMPKASTPYADEISLVKRILPLLPADERTTWQALLRANWRAKRNFIAGLDKISIV